MTALTDTINADRVRANMLLTTWRYGV